jgi:outer membrane protein assembly factor BamE (lipoprotein component of BamABCDE complex)
MKTKSSPFILSVALAMALAGCATINIHGHEVTDEQLAKIKVGVTTRDQVAKLLGTPSSVSPFGNKLWFYMYDKRERRAFLTPTTLESNTTRIEFDDQNRVKSLESITEKDHQVISHIKRETPTSGHEFGVLEQIFGNVGRFNGKDPDQ